jgi:membrane protein
MKDRLLRHPRVAWVVAFVRACLQRLVELEFVDRAVALASLTFTALIPLGVVVGSSVPGINRDDFADSIIERFDLDPRTADIVQQAFSPPPNVQASLSVLGILLVIVSALSFTRGLQRVYETAWRLPRLGIRATPAGLMWLAGIIAFLSLFGGLRSAVVDLSRPAVSAIVALLFSCVVWMFTPWALLSRRVSWRVLLPTGVLTAVGMTCLSIGGIIYMPRSISDSAASYGTIGVAISLVSWFVAAGFILVGCAAVGAVLGERSAAAGDAMTAGVEAGDAGDAGAGGG